jgi:transcriptional regulator GlxA family with amidase domain
VQQFQSQSCIKPYTEHRHSCSPYEENAKRQCAFDYSLLSATAASENVASRAADENLDERVRHAIAIMEGYLHRELNLNEIASHVNLSFWHLSRLFTSEVGMPPGQYLKCLRLNKAKELLETTFLNVKEIKCRVGIKDESHFARSFKKAFGDAPAQYRARYLNSRVSGTGHFDRIAESASE